MLIASSATASRPAVVAMVSRSLLLSLCFAALLAISCVHAAGDIEVDDPDVTVLTDANFEAFIQDDLTLVEFYAPW